MRHLVCLSIIATAAAAPVNSTRPAPELHTTRPTRELQAGSISTAVSSGPWRSQRGWFNLHKVYSKVLSSLLDPEWGVTLARSDNTNVPSSLHGLWWMEGNPAPEYVASFGASTWQSGSCDDNGLCTGGCVDPNGGNAPHPLQVPRDADGTRPVCGGSLSIKCYDEKTWTWADNVGGLAMYGGATTTCMELTFFFNAEQTKAHIIPTGCTPIPFPMYFTLEKTDDPAVWLRRSHPWGTDSDTSFQYPYRLKQIVDGAGSPAAYWNEYVASASVGDTSLVSAKIGDWGWWGPWWASLWSAWGR